jgi:23S rRNA pseudouridine1911/1915/1917 synthase
VSGVVVLAKTPGAAAELSRQFRERLVEKRYEAVVEGRFPAALNAWVDWTDTVERVGTERRSRLGRDAGVTGGGRPGPPPDKTTAAGATDGEDLDDAGGTPGGQGHVRARVVVRRGEVSLVELAPSTGRRHQLRAQLAGRGCPIVGDRTYGARLPFLTVPRTAIALRSSWLRIGHPATGRPLELEAERPAAWRERFPGLFMPEGRFRPG